MFAIQIPTVFSLSCHACLIKHLNKPVHIYLVFWLLHFYTWVSISSLQELVLPHYLTGKLVENFFLCCPSLGEHLFDHHLCYQFRILRNFWLISKIDMVSNKCSRWAIQSIYCNYHVLPFEIRTGIQIVQPFEYRTLKSPVFRWIRYSDGYCMLT